MTPIFLVIFVLLGIPLILFLLNENIRSSRFSKLAKKFGLEFKRNRTDEVSIKNKLLSRLINIWRGLTSSNYLEEKNIIRGKINNHYVEIYDCYTKDWSVFFEGNYTKKRTIMKIDGMSRKVDLASAALVDKILTDLRDKNLIFVRKFWNIQTVILYILYGAAALLVVYLLGIKIYKVFR